LKRWDIVIDDSAGRSLDRTPVGAFLRLTAAMVAEDFAPVATLAACKHPLATAGLDSVVFRTLSRTAERMMLRGPRPAAGLAGLRALAAGLTHRRRDAEQWAAGLERCFAAFAEVMTRDAVPLDVIL